MTNAADPIDAIDPPDNGTIPADVADPSPRRARLFVGLVLLLAIAGGAVFLLQNRQSDTLDDQAGPGGGQASAGADGQTEDGKATLDVDVGDGEETAGDQGVGTAVSVEVDDESDASTDDAADSTDQEDPDEQPITDQIQAAADVPISIVGMTSLSNVPLRTNRATYRFTADRTGEVDSVRLYYIVNTSRTGYANGTGGTVLMTVAPDDGSGLPDEANLFAGRAEATFGLNGGAIIGDRSSYVRDTLFGRWDFSEPIPVVAGQDYHIVFQNLDPDPTNNYVILDLVIDLLPDSLQGSDPIPSPAARSEFGFVQSSGDGWRLADAHPEGHRQTPIFEVTYTDGNTQGQGFMQYEARGTFALTGSSAIRTTITVPEDRTVSQFAARVGAQAGGAVILEMTTMDGEVLRSVQASTDAVANYRNAVWAEGSVEPLTLTAGTQYAFVVRAAPGYSGDVVPLQAGVNYGFAPKSVFPFGVAQTSPDGSSWTNWRNGLFYQSISIR
ncbi:MAG: hypothetical protein AAGA65_00570 [Actinomycetota bacterium]